MSNLEVIGNYKNGPDQVIPASSFKTWNADGATQVFLSDEEAASYKPKSVYTMLKETAKDYPNHPALAVKRGVWKYWTYKEYFEESKTVAKAFIKLGLDRFHGVCIMGFNSPEWVIANYGAVFAGGLSTGVYTTNSPEACRYLADSCDAQIIVVEDVTCLNKFLAVKRFLPSIKAIIQWSGIPGAPGVLSWPELLATGLAEKDTELNERLSLSAVNQCCTLIYTSVNNCKERWRNLHIVFIQKLKLPPSGLRRKNTKPYYLKDSKQFLLLCVKVHQPIGTPGNLPSLKETQEDIQATKNEDCDENLPQKESGEIEFPSTRSR